MTTRTLLLGDWHPIVRDPLDVLRAAFGGAALIFAVLGMDGAVNVAVAAVAVIAVRLLDLPRPYDFSFIAAMALVGWGEALRLYDRFPYYDLLVHFLVPLLGAPCVYILLARLDVLSDPKDHDNRRRYAGLFVVTLALGLALGAAWEIFEWTADTFVGTNLSLGERDVIGDLVADAAGALAGAVLLVLWAARGWGSVRRVTGRLDPSETEAS